MVARSEPKTFVEPGCVDSSKSISVTLTLWIGLSGPTEDVISKQCDDTRHIRLPGPPDMQCLIPDSQLTELSRRFRSHS